ncbi:MAG: type II/IV secretion system ATPase subunit [Thermoplasmata archaeon]
MAQASLKGTGFQNSPAQIRKKNPHIQEYIETLHTRGINQPEFVMNLDRDLKGEDSINLIYPVGDPIFIHIYGNKRRGFQYNAVEPTFDASCKDLYEEICDYVFMESAKREACVTTDQRTEMISELVDEYAEKKSKSLLGIKKIPKDRLDRVKYRLIRDLSKLGPIEPLMRDPYIEDIYVVGLDRINLVHKIFEGMRSNIQFESLKQLKDYLVDIGSRVNITVDASAAVFDTAMPDGSRLNIIFPEDVSIKGPSFTIRKFAETPLTITQLINWNTFSTKVGAYLWMLMEHGCSVFVSGETASGKTTTLNSILPFIRRTSKIYSVEDTAEVLPPHDTWQQMIVKDSKEETASVEYFDLIKSAMRSRPNYVLVGEIRGKEGNIAFQTMQTGIPVLSTFHAASVHKLIQRISSDPINVPLHFIPNLDAILIQLAVYVKGEFLRRMISLTEVTGYLREKDQVMVGDIFRWDPQKDGFDFTGRYNSMVLEEKIAPKMGITDKREIYEELDRRALILERMIRNEIFDYHEFIELIRLYQKGGVDALPGRLRV